MMALAYIRADQQAKAEAYRIAIMGGGVLGRRNTDERRW